MIADDQRAITAVLIRYATGIDRRDWQLFASCFAEGCSADYPGFGLWHGPAEITDFMAAAHAPLGPTLHRMTNFTIQITGDTATAQSYVDALLMPGTAGGDVHRAAGWYDDRLVRTADGWRISHRRFNAVHIS
jgi:hypothetical protein